MKLKIFDRIIFVLLVLCLAAASLAAIALVWRILSLAQVAQFLMMVDTVLINRIIATAGALVLLFLCLRLLFVRERTNITPASYGLVIRTGENGTACITKAALEGIVLKFARSNTNVKDAKCDIMTSGDAVSIGLRLQIMPGINIPETVNELQSTLKEHVEVITGISVRDVPVVIESAGGTPNARTN